ncbi:MAG: putative oxidoreductase C-terminal domain-containing protein [Puia sp.]|nr:putative oxidoreductase C-terminal domain-containing protein [Puia sp.]
MNYRNIVASLFILSASMGSPAGGFAQQPGGQTPAYPIRLITLDPGHFHAALVQKSMYPEIDPVVHVYAPDGPELTAHLDLIEKYNTRSQNPAAWKEEVYKEPDFLTRMLRDRAGNVVVIAGNNRKKIDYISQCIDSGYHVLADKPMVIRPDDFKRLQAAFARAKKNKVILYDIMTERYQITTILQRALAGSPAVFGSLQKGTEENPAVTKESVHHFFKYVSGKPLTRPDWYFDVEQEGEGIVDVTTHLVDLIQWECFPDIPLDYRKDIRMLSARRWPTLLTPGQFKLSTGENGYPAFLQKYVSDTLLTVYANGEMNYTLKGIHARVSVKWNFQAPEGSGDTHFSMMRGTLANLVIRQGREQQYKPVLYVEPVRAAGPAASPGSGAASDYKAYETVLQQEIDRLQSQYPGLGLKKVAQGWEVVIPEKYSLDHEATFAEVTKKYLRYVREGQMPAWEEPAMLTKYYTTMKALEMAKAHSKKP